MRHQEARAGEPGRPDRWRARHPRAAPARSAAAGCTPPWRPQIREATSPSERTVSIPAGAGAPRSVHEHGAHTGGASALDVVVARESPTCRASSGSDPGDVERRAEDRGRRLRLAHDRGRRGAVQQVPEARPRRASPGSEQSQLLATTSRSPRPRSSRSAGADVGNAVNSSASIIARADGRALQPVARRWHRASRPRSRRAGARGPRGRRPPCGGRGSGRSPPRTRARRPRVPTSTPLSSRSRARSRGAGRLQLHERAERVEQHRPHRHQAMKCQVANCRGEQPEPDRGRGRHASGRAALLALRAPAT